MEVTSAKDFRCKQTAFLTKVKKGEDIVLTSRVGSFRIVPISKEDAFVGRVSGWGEQVKLLREGKQVFQDTGRAPWFFEVRLAGVCEIPTRKPIPGGGTIPWHSEDSYGDNF